MCRTRRACAGRGPEPSAARPDRLPGAAQLATRCPTCPRRPRGTRRPRSGDRRAGRPVQGMLISFRSARGQASLMMLAVIGVLLAITLGLFAFGSALGAKGRHQRVADLAAVSAAQAMRQLYPRLFEPPFLAPDLPNPRHLEEATYRALARAAAVRGADRNGVQIAPSDVSFPGDAFAPTRVTVRVRGDTRAKLSEGPPERVRVSAKASAELSPDLGATRLPAIASGGGYDGPLAYRQGKPRRPDVALAFDRMAAAAREEAGILLSVTSGFRSDAEQARLFAAHPDPEVGGTARREPAPLRHRARSRPEGGICLARRERDPVRLPPALQLGAASLVHAGGE